MNEQEHNLTLRFGDKEFEMTRDNASLFTFIGDLATRNHVFIVTGEETEDTVQGTYVFSFGDSFDALAAYMLEHDYPAHVNLRTVADCDEKAFQNGLENLTGSMDDLDPSDFFNES